MYYQQRGKYRPERESSVAAYAGYGDVVNGGGVVVVVVAVALPFDYERCGGR